MKTAILFYLKRSKINQSNGLIPIYLRITVNGKREEISIGKSILESEWNVFTHRAKGNSLNAQAINNRIIKFEGRITEFTGQMFVANKQLSAKTIKDYLTGNLNEQHTLIEACDYTINKIKSLIGIEYATSTLEKYVYTKDRLVEFMHYHLNISDIALDDLSETFIRDFDLYLKSSRRNQHNSAAKYVKNLKAILEDARRSGWIPKNPFRGFSCSYEETNKIPLTMSELITMENKQLPTPGLDLVRDVFVFAAYTGYAFVDVKQLKYDNIEIGDDGRQWIIIDRKKTGVQAPTRLTGEALAIIEKYRHHPFCIESRRLFPLGAAQTVNKYLKEIANLCGINKKLTFHIARYTYASTIALSNGVPIETVMKSMGLTNVKRALEYAKLSKTKMSNDFNDMENKIKAIKAEYLGKTRQIV